jgi:hypothetical protein
LSPLFDQDLFDEEQIVLYERNCPQLHRQTVKTRNQHIRVLANHPANSVIYLSSLSNQKDVEQICNQGPTLPDRHRPAPLFGLAGWLSIFKVISKIKSIVQRVRLVESNARDVELPRLFLICDR